MLKIKDIELKLQLEKMVIGIEEPILIKGAGKFIAKVDSGNGGYNVIHGEDFVMQGDILNFKTFDADGAEKRISKKIHDTINVNIGGGNIQERPVVELDIKFADEEYKKIPFSVTDRSSNNQKVLLSKDFVKNELQALIDVGKTNMTEEEPVEVDYVTESSKNKPVKGGAFARHREKDPTGLLHPVNSIKQAGKKIANSTVNTINHPIKSAKSGVEKVTNFMDKLAHGADHFDSTYNTPADLFDDSENTPENSKVRAEIANLPKYIKVDESLILQRIEQERAQITQSISPNAPQEHINFNVVRLMDYTNHIAYGNMLEIKNSLFDKNLEEIAAANIKPTVTVNNTQNNLVNSSYLDRWMSRYEYLIESKRKKEKEEKAAKYAAATRR